ncbi:unnamed protein product [Darwinula stevensoni]|uniref:CUB domain-containing protein n=1 Tax=Darwinula stevensoni TaxID=69355 RepID=A0A7R9A3W1_9CRUS|nr:unnamed protein product [Darwinula stevensoni]CAG0892438.1 unnamed protein product [Darwinula stevensoni]
MFRKKLIKGYEPSPSSSSGSCTFGLSGLASPYCGYVLFELLDFDNFELAEPNMPDGTKAAKCRDDDSFVIEGGHEINPLNLDHIKLCGNNTGQHLYTYVHLNTSAVPITFTLLVQADTSPYKWKIRTTMIDCTKESRLKAPSQCLQYYIGSEGTIQSFNYGRGSSNYLGNLDYQICINREFNKCGILYTATNSPSTVQILITITFRHSTVEMQTGSLFWVLHLQNVVEMKMLQVSLPMDETHKLSSFPYWQQHPISSLWTRLHYNGISFAPTSVWWREKRQRKEGALIEMNLKATFMIPFMLSAFHKPPDSLSPIYGNTHTMLLEANSVIDGWRNT